MDFERRAGAELNPKIQPAWQKGNAYEARESRDFK
jgi:hypothetical protein